MKFNLRKSLAKDIKNFKNLDYRAKYYYLFTF